MSKFEQASRMKLRFITARGNLTSEDLWDLPLQRGVVTLDGLAIALDKDVKESAEHSFVTPTSKDNAILKLKFDIVKHVIEVKLAEREAKTTALADKQHNEKIDRLIEKKEDESLQSLSVEALEKLRK